MKMPEFYMTKQTSVKINGAEYEIKCNTVNTKKRSCPLIIQEKPNVLLVVVKRNATVTVALPISDEKK